MRTRAGTERPGAGDQIRVFLLDDHEVVRRGVRDPPDDEPGITVVGEAGTAEQAPSASPRRAPGGRARRTAARRPDRHRRRRRHPARRHRRSGVRTAAERAARPGGAPPPAPADGGTTVVRCVPVPDGD